MQNTEQDRTAQGSPQQLVPVAHTPEVNTLHDMFDIIECKEKDVGGCADETGQQRATGGRRWFKNRLSCSLLAMTPKNALSTYKATPRQATHT